ncbi:MAG: methyltransferase domain-containing protein [Candidatus Omnitrophica bacterium]|nr:methyltransferase domain-containing protein [Candidatus Omnitrophota bacterium]
MSLLHKIYKKLHYNVALPDEKGEYSSGVWQDAARKQTLECLAGREGRILEIGCGEGLLLAQLQKVAPNAELYGIDNSEQRIELAKSRLEPSAPGISSRLTLADATNLPFPDDYFNATICINVTLALPSFDIVKAVITEMARITKKGGYIIFEYRNKDNFLLSIKYRLAPYYDLTVKGHPFTMLKPAEVDKFLGDIRLKLRRKIYLTHFFNRNAWLRNIAPIIVIEAEKS